MLCFARAPLAPLPSSHCLGPLPHAQWFFGRSTQLIEQRFSKEEMEDIERRKYDTEEQRTDLVPMLRDVRTPRPCSYL